MYDPLPPTAVNFTSTDTALQNIVRHAEAEALLNIKPFISEGHNSRGEAISTRPLYILYRES
jgi:hypothetical protein